MGGREVREAETLGVSKRAATLRACAGCVRRPTSRTTKKTRVPPVLPYSLWISQVPPRVISAEAAPNVPLGATEGRRRAARLQLKKDVTNLASRDASAARATDSAIRGPLSR